jgi:DnaJ family protein C protein 28
LIQEAMSKGDFNNLSGAGKPLQNLQTQNPYSDFTTEKMNKILIDNGFVPEWITLQKEIRDESESLAEKLREERSKLHSPLEPGEDYRWQESIDKCQEATTKLNKKIDKFNLIVPVMNKQMMHVQLARIADEILKEQPESRPTPQPIPESKAPSDYKPSLFSLIDSLIK